jgi:hypothetical protein
MSDEKFDYFIETTNDRLKNIESKLDELISFRLMLMGASLAVSSIASIIIAFLFGH